MSAKYELKIDVTPLVEGIARELAVQLMAMQNVKTEPAKTEPASAEDTLTPKGYAMEHVVPLTRRLMAEKGEEKAKEIATEAAGQFKRVTEMSMAELVKYKVLAEEALNG